MGTVDVSEHSALAADFGIDAESLPQVRLVAAGEPKRETDAVVSAYAPSKGSAKRWKAHSVVEWATAAMPSAVEMLTPARLAELRSDAADGATACAILFSSKPKPPALFKSLSAQPDFGKLRFFFAKDSYQPVLAEFGVKKVPAQAGSHGKARLCRGSACKYTYVVHERGRTLRTCARMHGVRGVQWCHLAGCTLHEHAALGTPARTGCRTRCQRCWCFKAGW